MTKDPFDGVLDDMEMSSPAPGTVVINHAAHVCAGKPCCIHNPSDHHMRDWPMAFRSDSGTYVNRRMFVLTERTCPHGIGHPDPDSLAFAREIGNEAFARAQSLHSCDRCCHAVRATGIEPVRPESSPFEGDASA